MTNITLGYDKNGHSKEALERVENLLKETGLEFKIVGMVDVGGLNGVNLRVGLAHYQDITEIEQFCEKYRRKNFTNPV